MRSALVQGLRRMQLVTLLLVDSMAWVAAMYLAAALRLDTPMASASLRIPADGSIPLHGVLAIAAVAASTHALVGWLFRLHQGRSALGSFEELFILASVLIVSGVVATVFNILLAQPFIPRTTPIAAAFIALVFCAWPRALWRVLLSQSRHRRSGATRSKVLIVGAGEGGRQLVLSMQRDPEDQWEPVGFVDDNRRKRHFRYRGLSVLGTTKELGRIAHKSNVSTIVIAIPSASSETISRLNDLAREADLDVKVLPGVNDMLSGVRLSAMRDLAPEDLLGRHQVDIDIQSIASYLAGKRVLVTGAGGSIGSELCRQINQFAPASLIVLDRDESALHSLMLSLHGRADLEQSNVVLASIREATRVREVFAEHRPEVVFHAAALKHVNMLEGHPAEAVKTNVLGTINVLEAAAEQRVERFVNISTDKAADPISVLGYTKRIAEGLTASFAAATHGVFLSVRFGNVLGTSGSVLKTFATQVDKGGPITVTDPDVTRYFMTIDEAVKLVIQAAAIGRDGEALVLDMGEPVKILEVAQRMSRESSQDIDIVFTGLKTGEKLHEILLGPGEPDVRPVHPLVSHIPVPVVAPETVRDLARRADDDQIIAALQTACRSMTIFSTEPSLR